MQRGNKLIFVAHCLLNANSKLKNLASYSGVKESVIRPYLEDGYGIIQLPCPETLYGSLNRWGMTYEQYDHPAFRRFCTALLQPYMEQIRVYLNSGCAIDKIIGVAGSPNCGIYHTCRGYEGGSVISEAVTQQQESLSTEKGSGVFMEELKRMMAEMNLCIPMEETWEEK